MKVKDILQAKGSAVETTTEDTTLMQAITVFFEKRIGSLIVKDANDKIAGIMAPNDVLQAVKDGCEGGNCSIIRVKEVMTKEIICASEDDTVDYIQAVMTENRIRHIPIMDKDQLKGIVSIGDVVKAQIKEKDVENHYLRDYIEGKYPA